MCLTGLPALQSHAPPILNATTDIEDVYAPVRMIE